MEPNNGRSYPNIPIGSVAFHSLKVTPIIATITITAIAITTIIIATAIMELNPIRMAAAVPIRIIVAMHPRTSPSILKVILPL